MEQDGVGMVFLSSGKGRIETSVTNNLSGL